MKENSRVYEFFKKLDRSIFIDDEYKAYSHYDNPLPIGYGQTISQPTLVCYMVEKLDIRKDSKVLEIGTGSGYQTAFLAEFAHKVYTIEKISELSVKAEERLKELGYSNITYEIGDASGGLHEYSPYDRIIVSAAARNIPEALKDQLAPEGVMIIPVGDREIQDLLQVTKEKDGHIEEKFLMHVKFVEFKGKYGWD